jgi:hypothetical protein
MVGAEKIGGEVQERGKIRGGDVEKGQDKE